MTGEAEVRPASAAFSWSAVSHDLGDRRVVLEREPLREVAGHEPGGVWERDLASARAQHIRCGLHEGDDRTVPPEELGVAVGRRRLHVACGLPVDA